MSNVVNQFKTSLCRKEQHYPACRDERCSCTCHAGTAPPPPLPVVDAPQRPLAAVPAAPAVPPGMRWEDPPPGAGRPSVGIGEPILRALKANPGRWANIREFPGATSASSSQRKLRKTYPGFEFAGRRNRTGKGSTLYARWVGET